MKRLKDKSDVPKAKLGTLPKHVQAQIKDKATFYSLAEEPEEREFVVDSGASVHVVSKRDLNSAELETMRTSRSRRR